MSKVSNGRYSAALEADDETVLFLIGMRVNHVWQVWKWLPIVKAMTAMLVELRRHPDLGLLGTPRTYLSGRVVLVQQYWKSFELLDQYSRAADLGHLPEWRRFNRRIRGNGSVGIFHETYLIRQGKAESVYVNMPTFGLAEATSHVLARQVGQTAATRIGVRTADTPPVEPY